MAFFRALTEKYPTFADGQAALSVMQYKLGTPNSMSLANDDWEDAVEQDSRYTDASWVREIRRWPPLLVSHLEEYLKARQTQTKI